MPNEPIEPGAGGRVEDGSNDTSDFGYDGNWRGDDEPVETDLSVTDIINAGGPEISATVVDLPSRHGVTEQVLHIIGMNWPQFCALESDAKRRALIVANLPTIASAGETEPSLPDEMETAVQQALTLTSNIAAQSQVGAFKSGLRRDGEPISWLARSAQNVRRSISGVRTLGFSELGRALAAKVNTNDEQQANDLELSIRESRQLHTAQAAVATVGTVGLLSTVGRSLMQWGTSFINPVARAAVGATTGVTTYFSTQQLSGGLFSAVRRNRNFNNYLRNKEVPAETPGLMGSIRSVRDDEVYRATRQANLDHMSGRLNKLVYRFMSQPVLEGINRYYEAHRLQPADLERLTSTDEGVARLEDIVALLQHDLDERWVRGDKEAGLLGDDDDWEYQLYLRALTLLAERPAEALNGQSATIAHGLRQGQRTTRGLKLASHSVGVALGAAAGYAAYVAGIGATANRAEAQPSTESNPATPEVLRPEQVNQAIENNTLRLFGVQPASAHELEVRDAIANNDDLSFYEWTGHHLTDLRYAEHALRAQLVEQLAHEQASLPGHEALAGTDVWHSDGTVDISVLGHSITGSHIQGAHIEGNQVVFDNLNADQLTTHLGNANAAVFTAPSFAEWRIGEVTMAVQSEAAHLASAHGENITGFQAALHEHLREFVQRNASNSDFSLTATNHEGATLLRVEARQFMTDWLKRNQAEAVSPVATAVSTVDGHSHAEPVVVGNLTGHQKATVDLWPNFLAPEKHANGLELDVYQAPVQTLADNYIGVAAEQPALNVYQSPIDNYIGSGTEHEVGVVNAPDLTAAGLWHGPKMDEPSFVTHSDAVSVAQASGLVEPQHVAVDNGYHPTLPADTLREVTNHPAGLETNNAAALEHQLFTKPAEVMKPVDTVEQVEKVKPELPTEVLHHYVATTGRESILIGEADLGEQIPNEVDSFVAK